MQMLRRHRRRRTNELAQLLVALDKVSGARQLPSRRRTSRLSLGSLR